MSAWVANVSTSDLFPWGSGPSWSERAPHSLAEQTWLPFSCPFFQSTLWHSFLSQSVRGNPGTWTAYSMTFDMTQVSLITMSMSCTYNTRTVIIIIKNQVSGAVNLLNGYYFIHWNHLFSYSLRFSYWIKYQTTCPLLLESIRKDPLSCPLICSMYW